MRVEENLGDIVLVKIEKKKYWMQDDWYCKYITVKTPSGDYVEFPCFRWLVDDKEVVLRDGQGSHQFICLFASCSSSFIASPESPSLTLSVVARLPQDDKTSLVKQHRQKELDSRRKTYRQVSTSISACYRRLRLLTDNCAALYRWKEWQPGFPMSIDANRHKDLPRDIQFDSEKGVDFVLNYSKAYVLPLTAFLSEKGLTEVVITDDAPQCNRLPSAVLT